MEIVGQFAAVVAVLGLAAASSWWWRRRGFAGALAPRKAVGRRRLESAGRLPLGPQQTLHLVRLGERALLVASSPSQCVLLEAVPWREVEPGGEAPE